MRNEYYESNITKRYFREILTGNDCNLRCKYCYEHGKANKVTSKEDVKTFIEYFYKRDFDTGIFRRYDNIAPKINFIGGEPLLHPDLIDYALSLIHEQNIKYDLTEGVIGSIITNGTLISISTDVQNLLKKWHDKISLSFSIDGTKEAHDKYRVDANGGGSYDAAIAGYRIARDILGNDKCFAKMTLGHETMHTVSDGVINLFNEGFDRVQCTVILEENWPEEEAEWVYKQHLHLIDYMVENGLYKTKVFLPFRRELAFEKTISENPNCSACKSGLLCIGCDHKIYGCHHFATLTDNLDSASLGRIDDGQVIMDNLDLINKVTNIWKSRPEKCLDCSLGAHCTNCAASIYGYNPQDPSDFFNRYNQCGYTKGLHKARMVFKDRIAQAETPQDE